MTTVPTFSAAQLIGILINIGNWIFVIGILIVPIMVIIGATFFLTGGDNPNKIATAKTIFVWTGVGLALMLLAKGVFAVVQRVIGA